MKGCGFLEDLGNVQKLLLVYKRKTKILDSVKYFCEVVFRLRLLSVESALKVAPIFHLFEAYTGLPIRDNGLSISFLFHFSKIRFHTLSKQYSVSDSVEIFAAAAYKNVLHYSKFLLW